MDENVTKMQEEEDAEENWWAFLDSLSPQAHGYVMRWLVLPWTMSELLEGEPDGEAVRQEFRDLGVLQLEDWGWELNPSLWKGM